MPIGLKVSHGHQEIVEDVGELKCHNVAATRVVRMYCHT